MRLFVISGILLAPKWDAAMKALGRQMPSGAIGISVLYGFFDGHCSNLALRRSATAFRAWP
jgi:hypothetical protein